MITEFIEENDLGEAFLANAQKWFIPLAEKLAMHRKGAKGPVFLGINGCQGSGKSTLASFLRFYLSKQYGFKVCNLSLDDFYFSKSYRLDLSIKIHPLLEVRGVPGTHDTRMMANILTQLQNDDGEVQIPRFDKSVDNPFPREKWENMSLPTDIVILEGWCWGVTHQPKNKLDEPVNGLEQEEDGMGVWRQYVNKQLQEYYEPLYSVMDYWCMLKAPSFSVVHQWRLEQEQKLAKKLGDQDRSGLMNEAQIKRFISYYQRLTEHGLETLPEQCDWVFELDTDRNIIS
jgi:D-glycerate 3-kinase